EETVVGPTVVVTENTDDLARLVDPTCTGALDEDGIIERCRGIIESGVNDWHVIASLIAWLSSWYPWGRRSIRADPDATSEEYLLGSPLLPRTLLIVAPPSHVAIAAAYRRAT